MWEQTFTALTHPYDQTVTPHRRRWLFAIALAIAVLAVALIPGPRRVPTGLPVELDITVLRDHSDLGTDDAPLIVRVTETYTLRFASWRDWTLRTTCCVDPFDPRTDPTGDAKQQRPDGTAWHRTAQPARWVAPLPTRLRTWLMAWLPGADIGAWEQTSEGHHDGSSPWPDFFPPWDEPTDVSTRGRAVAEALGLDPADLSARRGGGLVRTFYDPLGIPIHAFTEEDGQVTHEMTVTAIRPG